MYIYNLGQKFKLIVEAYKDKTAIIFDGKEAITFWELEELSNQVANFLIRINIKKGDVIAIQNNKTQIGFATMIACLKLGIIYTNFDYTNPIERIKKIFWTASPKLVFADIWNENVDLVCNSMKIPYIAIDIEYKENIENQNKLIADDILRQVSCHNPAYIMFTSGSTGSPKGVLVKQESLLNFIEWGKYTYQLTDEDIMTNVNPIYFDNSVFDFYCSLFNGITMVAISKSMTEKPKEMLQIIEENSCTFWFSVPSMLIYLTNLKLLRKDILKKIRIFSFGGEGYPKELLRKLYKLYSESAFFYNVYGPTEGTCICSAYKITKEDIEQEGFAPLGEIASNFGYVILDENDRECSLGELCLIGSQLAIGYYNDEERTNFSFVRNPICKKYYEKMYRTGDIVEKIDGKLYFRGRSDNQIKHMGYRIELEEIENALIKIPGIKQCAVIHAISKNNLSKLVAYVAVEKSIDEKILRKELKKYLPYYMIPHSFVYLDELPKNTNGKVDRAYLKLVNDNVLM